MRSVRSLQLWLKNPRFNGSDDIKSNDDVLRALTKSPKEKREFMSLMSSISEIGFQPLDPILAFQDLDTEKLVVVEGNRRLLACKLLRDNETRIKSFKTFTSRLKTLNGPFKDKKIEVSIAPSFEDCLWYISQRNSLSSLQLRWSSEQQRRWITYLVQIHNGDISKVTKDSTLSTSEISQAIRTINLLDLTRTLAVNLNSTLKEKLYSKDFPVTTIERFFNFRIVQENWYISFEGSEVIYTADKFSLQNAVSELVRRMLLPSDNTQRIDSRSLGTSVLVEGILDSLPKPLQRSLQHTHPQEQEYDSFNGLEPGIHNNETSTIDSDQQSESQPPDETDHSDPSTNTSAPNNHDGLRRGKLNIPSDLSISLTNLNSSKINSILNSMTKISAKNNIVVLTIAFWSLIEILTAIDGRRSNTNFLSYFSKDKMHEYGLRDQYKPLNTVLERIQDLGNSSKHHEVSANFNPSQLQNDISSLSKLLSACAKKINAN